MNENRDDRDDREDRDEGLIYLALVGYRVLVYNPVAQMAVMALC
jgi:hypothetical protein